MAIAFLKAMFKVGKINWREKPNHWEVILMVVAGIVLLGVLAALAINLQSQQKASKERLEKLDVWTNAMLFSSEQARASLGRLRPVDVEVLNLLDPDAAGSNKAVEKVIANWNINTFKRCLEMMPFIKDRAIAARLRKIYAEKYGAANAYDDQALYKKLWQLESDQGLPDLSYPDFKALLYRRVDPTNFDFFGGGRPSSIDLSEVVWTGDDKKESSPLRQPRMIVANLADLAADEKVFGLSINGDSRAYPLRRIARHSLFSDRIGGIDVVGVTSATPPAMIVYETKIASGNFSFVPSGFSYRSDKLLYDEQTKSLWSASSGEPLKGEMVGKGIKLVTRPVKVTEWNVWRAQYPATKVMAPLDTQREVAK